MLHLADFYNQPILNRTADNTDLRIPPMTSAASGMPRLPNSGGNLSLEQIRMDARRKVEFLFASYDRVFFPEETLNGQTFQWMSQDAKLRVFSPLPNTVFLSCSAWSYHRPRRLTFKLNGVVQGEHHVKTSAVMVGERLELKAGENVIEFHARERCERPSAVEGLLDTRCVSVAVADVRITLLDRLHDAALLGNGWYRRSGDLIERSDSPDGSQMSAGASVERRG